MIDDVIFMDDTDKDIDTILMCNLSDMVFCGWLNDKPNYCAVKIKNQLYICDQKHYDNAFSRNDWGLIKEQPVGETDRDEINELLIQREHYRNDISQHNKTIAELEYMIDTYKDREDKSVKKIVQLEEENQQHKNRIVFLETEIKELKSTIKQYTDRKPNLWQRLFKRHD